MPKRYKPFDVMRETDSRQRLSNPRTKILYGEIGPPREELDLDGRVAWLDIVAAAPPGVLERHDRFHVELTSRILSNVRRGDASKGMVNLLGKCLRKMGLTPSAQPAAVTTLDAFKASGPVN